MKLYAWQRECVERWKENGGRGIVRAVTGSGKTAMALHAVREMEHMAQTPIRVRIVVPTCVLASQWAGAMEELLPDVKSGQERPGRWGGGRHDNPGRRYMIYVVNSARYSLARHVLRDWEQGVGVFLIADECHRYASPENRRIFDFLEEGAGPYYSMGLSATPEGRGFGSVLEPALGKMIYRYGFSEAAANRNVSRFAAYQIALSFTPEEREEYDVYGRRIAAVRKRLLEERPALRKLGRHAFLRLCGKWRQRRGTIRSLRLSYF